MASYSSINVGSIVKYSLLSLGFLGCGALAVLFGLNVINIPGVNSILSAVFSGLAGVFIGAGLPWKSIRSAFLRSGQDWQASASYSPMPHHESRISENRVPQPKRTYAFRIAGKSGSGKTQLINQYVYETFEAAHQKTFGVQYHTKPISTKGDNITLQLWEIPNHQGGWAFDIGRSILRTTEVFFLVFDVCDKDSFEYAKNLCAQVYEDHGLKYNVVLVGNKIDDKSRRQVTAEEAQDFANSKVIIYKEVSAKTPSNVNELFTELVDMVHQRLTTKTVEVEKPDEKSDVRKSGFFL